MEGHAVHGPLLHPTLHHHLVPDEGTAVEGDGHQLALRRGQLPSERGHIEHLHGTELVVVVSRE